MPAFETYGSVGAAFGYAEVNYRSDGQNHKGIIHLVPFDNTLTFTSPATMNIGGTDTTLNTVGDYLTNIINIMKPLYPGSAQFILADVYQSSHSATVPDTFKGSIALGIAGTGGGDPLAVPGGQLSLNFKTVGNSLAKVTFLDSKYLTFTKTGLPTLYAPVNTLIAALIDSNAAVGKDGTAFTALRSVTFTENKRLRRHRGNA